jgi:aspartyl protease family protein
MKNFWQTSFSVLIFLLGLSPQAFAGECAGKFFSKADYGNQFPLKHPTKDFARALEKANEGIAVEQRNLAISYDTGYLVSRCPTKALYWYKKAAESGDDTAKKWLSRHASFATLHAGPECIGRHCPIADADANFVAVLYSNAQRSNHYFAPVTINGHTAEGMIDTGASHIAMNSSTAKSFGINYSDGKAGKASIANGQTISTTSIMVPVVEIAGIKLRDVLVSINEGSGDMLIGMSFLSRVNLAMGQGTLSMRKRE